MSDTDLPAATAPADPRSSAWKWYICLLLLMGTVVNYMDRLTLNTMAGRIIDEFHLSKAEYGRLELGFGLAFAAGAISFGALVDRLNIYWLYPVVLVGWSAAGFLTGLSDTYWQLMACRVLLGFFEAGHFPCGLTTIQRLLEPRDRAMGNSLLQSGTALGAIIAPQVIKALLTDDPESWRTPFLVIGAGGCVWVVFWLASVRSRDIARPAPAPDTAAASAPGAAPADPDFLAVVFSYRFLCLAVMVVCINLNWHLFRVWLPLFLQKARGYEEVEMLDFSTWYYVAADAGILVAGALTGLLARKGFSVYGARMAVYFVCCLLTTLTTAAAFLDKGPMLWAMLMLVAAGGLGTFAAYYSLTQDLSLKHQGKTAGLLATTTWLVTASFHPLFGMYIDRTGDYDTVVGAMGWLPMVAFVFILLLWNRGRPASGPGAFPVAGR
jgi:ACS family hexuronate transporter-like MFS transporter